MLADRKKLALCRDGKGATPLHNAIIFAETAIVKYLLKSYPQAVNAQDHVKTHSNSCFFHSQLQNKRTPLHFAAALQDGGAMYRMLRRAGADPDLLDCVGKGLSSSTKLFSSVRSRAEVLSQPRRSARLSLTAYGSSHAIETCATQSRRAIVSPKQHCAMAARGYKTQITSRLLAFSRATLASSNSSCCPAAETCF